MRQERFFESVITATTATQTDAARADATQMDFLLMRSPTLNVLLIATPLASSAATSSAATSSAATPSADSAASASALTTDTSTKRARFFSDDYYHTPLNSSGSLQHQPSFRHAPYANHSVNRSSFYRKGRSSPFQEYSARTEKKTEKRHRQQADRYRVNLTFDSTKIEEFMAKLKPDSTVSRVTKSEPSIQTVGNAPPSNAQPTAQTTDKETINKENSSYPASDQFFLAWAKDFAASSDGDRQLDRSTALDKEIEQSLLLNQVITRIRHSLDLPSILETTVAQVREFLSADRLVLYQFDLAGENLADEHLASENLAGEHLAGEHATDSKLAHAGATGINQSRDDLIGQRAQVGHVTYEARLSEDISSVLNFAEEGCFRPCLDTYSRYLLGQPIAVDNIDQQYAHAGCLLDFLHGAQIKSKIIAPIIVKNQLWGLLIAHQCKNYRHWEKTETVFLQHIAEHLAVAIEQASLYQQLRQQKVSLESCVIERTQNLRDALSAAASADRTKGEFLSTMSHELRTPLTYIIGMSATLLRWSFGNLNERQRSYLTTINHSGERLLTVINDILEFAKIESGRSLLNVSEFPLSELIHSVVDRHQAMAESRDVTLAVECILGSNFTKFRADAGRIEQILANLINNAIKFTPAGGHITVQAREEDNTVLLEVEDSGIGIPKSQRKFLFEKFKQLESPFRRQYPGTGLGLAMTKHLVELHGGTIQVNSTLGEGSTFIVSLPTNSKHPLNVRYQVPSTLERISKPVVLLLETEENSAAIICELLTADGYEIIWLTPADDIALQLTLLKPAMLIADLSLLSHRQDEIKAIEQSITVVGTRVLALLGQPSSESSHIAHHDTLDKPIDPKRLIEKSRQLTTAQL